MAVNHAEDRALEKLVRSYGRLVRSVVFRIAGDRAGLVAEDVEQRVMVALWKVMKGEQEIRHPSSYIYRAAVCETVRVLKEERRGGESIDGLEQRADGRMRTPEELAGSKQLGATIMESLSALSGDRQRAVKAHLAGFEVREIMEMFGWPYNKARNLIARGMADLRKSLREKGIDG